jgi:dTDP-4-dehydrorhamnose 3,5-epimerase-like enzyme
MNQASELLPGAWYLPLPAARDPAAHGMAARSLAALARLGLSMTIEQEHHDRLAAGAIRGMHLQRPPHDGERLLYCSHGSVLVVLLEMRRGAGFGRARGVTLHADDPTAVLVPRNVALGYKALEDDTLVVVQDSAQGVPAQRVGVRYDSFGFDWRCATPQVDAHDMALPPLSAVESPF